MLTGTQTHKWAALIMIIVMFPVLLLLLNPAFQTGTSPESINYALMDKSNLHINISTVNPGIHALAADSANGLVIKVQVADDSGASISGAGVKLEASGSTGTSEGSFKPSEGFTDGSGTFISTYTPPAYIKADSGKIDGSSGIAANLGNNTLDITSRLSGTEKSNSLEIKLISTPVVFVHGYQASPSIFSGIAEYLKLQSYKTLSFSYKSENGVVAAASELSDYLQAKSTELENSGIQVKRFDLVTHSMGGLVARYYTCSSEYMARGDVRKLIFVSVPQKGSPFASLGLQYYEDKSMKDLVPGSSLYSSAFPSMINAGLNPSIQTGSILGRYDEVVGTESANLTEWKIETEIFEVGESSFTVDKLLNGEILQAANHKLVLYNKKVYERIQQMLETDIPFPSRR